MCFPHFRWLFIRSRTWWLGNATRLRPYVRYLFTTDLLFNATSMIRDIRRVAVAGRATEQPLNNMPWKPPRLRFTPHGYRLNDFSQPNQ